jgi:hypothetical protein
MLAENGCKDVKCVTRNVIHTSKALSSASMLCSSHPKVILITSTCVAVRRTLDACVAMTWRLGEVALAWQ